MKNLFLFILIIFNLTSCGKKSSIGLIDNSSRIREGLTLNDLLFATTLNAESYEVSGKCDDLSGGVIVTVGNIATSVPCFMSVYLATLDVRSVQGDSIIVTVRQQVGDSVSASLVNDQTVIATAPTVESKGLTNGLSGEILVTCTEAGEVVTFENEALSPNLQEYTCHGTTQESVTLTFLEGQETLRPNFVRVSSFDVNGNPSAATTQFDLPIDNVLPIVTVQAFSKVLKTDRNTRFFNIIIEDENKSYPFTLTSDSGVVSPTECLQSPCEVAVTGASPGTLTLTVEAGAVVDAAGNFNADAISARVPVCAPAFVLVPPLDGYTNDNFCVMKYEAKSDGSGGIVSKASEAPHEQNVREDAINECKALGEGYDLITNDEWQTLARNIELVEDNWSDGIIGSSLSAGHVDANPNMPLEASEDDNMGCINTGRTCDGSTWHRERRTHTLSNGEVVWDMSGNFSEWVKDNSGGDYGEDISMRLITNSSHTILGSLSGGLTTTPRVAKDQFGPTLDYTDSTMFPEGTTTRYLGYGNLDNSQGLITRGSWFLGNEESGIFDVNLVEPVIIPSYTGIAVRCVYRLSSVN